MTIIMAYMIVHVFAFHLADAATEDNLIPVCIDCTVQAS